MRVIRLFMFVMGISLLASCASSPEHVQNTIGNGSDWSYVTTTSNGTKFYLNTGDVADSSDRVAFLAKVEFPSEQTTAGVSYWSSEVWFVVLKEQHQFGAYETHMFDASGDEVYHIPANPKIDFSPVLKGSPIFKLHQAALEHL